MGSVFRFKQFSVDQQGCAMKINTDGVLLGALVDVIQASHILDIGTGTGVIAMMLAQRNVRSLVDAVEIDEEAFLRARLNFESSPFADRLTIYKGSFEELNPERKYDLMVSNPPFHTNSLHNPDERKRLARHTDIGFFEKLLSYGQCCLTGTGSLVLILPYELSLEVIDRATSYGLYLNRRINVYSFLHGECVRSIITLGRDKCAVEEHDFVIYKEKGIYSEPYRDVLKPFFLAF